MVVLLTITIAFFIFVDLVPIFQKKQWKLFLVYSFIMVFVYVLVFLYSLRIRVPSLSVPLKKMTEAIFGIWMG